MDLRNITVTVKDRNIHPHICNVKIGNAGCRGIPLRGSGCFLVQSKGRKQEWD